MKWLNIVVIIFLIYGTNGQQLYSSTSQTGIKKADPRTESLKTLLKKRHSPLLASSASFITLADKYKLDWKLLPSIAGVESGFETNGNVHDYNPFGYMCSSSPCMFKSYPEAIETVAKTISRGRAYKEYRSTGELLDLARPYNGVDTVGWAEKVQYFRGKLK